MVRKMLNIFRFAEIVLYLKVQPPDYIGKVRIFDSSYFKLKCLGVASLIHNYIVFILVLLIFIKQMLLVSMAIVSAVKHFCKS